jgi:TRAP-type mannitol/chloroaromatic compound transport system permease small subunit
MTHFHRFITQFIERLGLITGYLGLILVVNTALVVALRYAFNWAPIALQETMTYLHASLFMLGAAYTLKHDGHVRVDVFYQHYTEKKKALINLLGTLFLLFPTCIFILFICYPYVESSWNMNERSIEGNGLPWLYLLKGLLLLQPILLMLQGVAEIIKHIFVLQGRSLSELDLDDGPNLDGGHL